MDKHVRCSNGPGWHKDEWINMHIYDSEKVIKNINDYFVRDQIEKKDK